MKILKKFPQLFFIPLVLTAVLIACDDGGDDPTPPPEPEEIVTQNWNVDEVAANGASQGSQNVQVSFSQGGQYTLLIPSLEGLGTSGSWVLNSDESAIILNDGSLEVIAEIVEISEERMVLEFDFENYKGQVTTYRITLTT